MPPLQVGNSTEIADETSCQNTSFFHYYPLNSNLYMQNPLWVPPLDPFTVNYLTQQRNFMIMNQQYGNFNPNFAEFQRSRQEIWQIYMRSMQRNLEKKE